jgi:4a-hydroxytetrahydrobiopterin dehydratase
VIDHENDCRSDQKTLLSEQKRRQGPDRERTEEMSGRGAHWKLAADGKRIHRKWVAKDFLTALDFFRHVGRVAQAEDHHPDLHLRGYRNVTIELSTHDLGGLSENDFIMAATIDELPVELKK